ncbi:MAG: hypothetical protein CMI31_02830 [Opitutae bacterium]|nr:hypothetical protein [Opitutae bacterium]
MRRLLLQLACLGTLSLISSHSLTLAQEEKKPISLEEITIYATRSPQSSFDVPSIVSKIDARAPGMTLAGDIGDLFEFTPGVEVDDGPRRNGQTISIRGFDDEAILTLMDGRRQNFYSAHDGRFFIDPSLIKSVEIVKGASSAIYGGSAVGGVVAFETIEASDLLAPGQSSGGLASLGYRSANSEYSPTITRFGRSGDWDLLGSFSYRDSGNINQGGSNSLSTDDRVLQTLLKAGYSPNDLQKLKFQAQIFNNDGQEPTNGSSALSTSNPLVDKEIKDNRFSVKYSFENQSWMNPDLHLYYNDTEIEETNLTGANAGRIQSRELNTLGFAFDNQTTLSASDTNTQVISYGFEIFTDEQTGYSSTTGKRPGVPNGEATNYGFYFQDEISLDAESGKFLIIPAARFDQYESNDENGNSQDENELSPKLSLSYKPSEAIVFFGSWAQAFRAPNLTEIYSSGLHFPGIPFAFPDNNFIANPSLKPERVTTIELGTGYSFAEDKGQVKASWFTSDGKDFITSEVNVFAGTTTILNIPKAKIHGWELEGEYEQDSLTTKLGLSCVEAENDATGEYLSNNVPLTLFTGISYKLASSNGVIGWRARFAEANDKVGANDTATSGYDMHSIYYRWRPENEGLESLTIDLGIDNVFDKAYTKRFASLLEEGRSFVAKVSYEF